jgi:hypothetical protein
MRSRAASRRSGHGRLPTCSGQEGKGVGHTFVGPKTADYLKILVGLPVAAMDRHLLGFLELAGLGKLSYPAGQNVVHKNCGPDATGSGTLES